MTEYPTVDIYIETLKNQQDLALLFNDFNNNRYVLSKKYIFEFDGDCNKPLLWVEVNEETIISHMSKWLRIMQRHYLDDDSTTQKDLVELTKYTQKMSDYNVLYKVFKFFKTEISDDTFYEKLNRACPHHLPIKGGKLIDLKTGETRYRTKKDYFTYFSNVEYTKEKSEYFKDFINSVMCNNKDNLEYFQKMLGYSLTGDISARVFFIWWGVGANGKSIILNLMKEILKDQCQAVAKSVFINNGGKNSNGPETMQLKDCRLATFSETSAKECLNESLIKMISGNDSITCRALYKDPITFTPICKLILCTNHKPDFNGNDKANIDRVRFIPFNARFVDEPKKANEYKKILGVDKIIIEKYLNEFFSFCIDGAKEYYNNQKFEPPQEIKQAQTKYTQDQATISNFINDNYEINEKEKIRKSDVKIHYEAYCKDNDLKIEKVSLVYDALIELTGEPKKINGIYYFKGVSIKQIVREEEPNDLDD
jgi:putative DNA primase/helicase